MSVGTIHQKASIPQTAGHTGSVVTCARLLSIVSINFDKGNTLSEMRKCACVSSQFLESISEVCVQEGTIFKKSLEKDSENPLSW